MNALVQHQKVDPVVRTNLDFKLDDIPRFWFGDDPFRTRIFDALSLSYNKRSKTLSVKKHSTALHMTK